MILGNIEQKIFDRYTCRNFKKHIHGKYHQPIVNKDYRLLTEVKLASLVCYDGTCRHAAINQH